MPFDNSDLNQHTAKIYWHELQPHFVRGRVLYLAASLDLLEVAQAMLQDNSVYIAGLIEQQKIAPVSEQQALNFYQTNQQLWAVVLAPWVLVQPVADKSPRLQ
ncbi:DUF2288 domain-containing protein [Testudinibacter sp. TR-2022]|uniref:DUF2288 domain-containing protein n=1 Tax=Testudinibacter sp. TR-2022 TaxID=2585029 RepID=UPI001119C38D|nr:DUF2288 domain-containing protein [Testudinibacter sp. TR-2022]TNH05163.1 DUF2288 domain-containing protein [Pasteurellaceae bacterium Phil31]TNH05874.1 DUF2288 domain-containing protein [Testudinibacter sp. TR-2022]TNH11145.1 DUF2288 domain-containing protein [Testudinibacter sp. TR-2022]TNH12829.1 DUF2288 domain-containing protein [Testudinibacter sp. TR-2022]